MSTAEEIKKVVKEKYGAIAAQLSDASSRESASCCGPADCGCGAEVTGPRGGDHVTASLGGGATASGALGCGATAGGLGCGDPTAIAELRRGETVLDLGSGGGLDVLLSARRVGPDGFAYGLDMTDEMLALARKNQQEAGVTNATFLKGEIETIPLPDATVDVVISNCVINLSSDKSQVLAEAFRVLRPGGRLAVSDIVRRREVPLDVQRDMELWTGCIAGALHETDYREKLTEAGFEQVEIDPTSIYSGESGVVDAYMSASIRATKPSG